MKTPYKLIFGTLIGILFVIFCFGFGLYKVLNCVSNSPVELVAQVINLETIQTNNTQIAIVTVKEINHNISSLLSNDGRSSKHKVMNYSQTRHLIIGKIYRFKVFYNVFGNCNYYLLNYSQVYN